MSGSYKKGGIIATAALSAAAFVAANGFAACLAFLPGNPMLNLGTAAQEFLPYMAENGPLSAEPAAVATGLSAACAIWAAWAYALTHGGSDRQGEEHGSARWGTVREGRKFMDAADPDNNIVFTKRFGLAMSRPDHDPRYERNRNVLVVGGSGSGKTRSVLEPNIMQMNADFLVTDPKGETLPRVGQMLEDHGYDVRSFNTVDFTKSLHYNPIAYVTDEADILEFVACLIENTTGDEGHAGDPFWEKAERLLYVALVGYLVAHCPEADRSLSGLVTLLALAKAKEEDEDYMSPLDLLFYEIKSGKSYVETGEASDGADILSRGAKGSTSRFRWVATGEPVRVEDDFCLLHYKMFKDAAGKTMKSILVSCNTRMEPFAIPQVRHLVADDEMGLDRLGEAGGKRAVFAIMSDTSPLYSFLFAIMMWQTVNILCKKALVEHGGALPRPVSMLLDEFANIGKVPDIEKSIAVVRSRNISISLYLQSLSQLKGPYKDNAATIVDCCDTLLFLGGKSSETTKQVSESVGKETLSTVTWNESRGSQATSTRNWTTQERDLIQASEVAKLPRDEAIVLITGTDPLKDEKFRIEGHRRWPEVHPGHKGGLHKEPYDFTRRIEDLRGGTR